MWQARQSREYTKIYYGNNSQVRRRLLLVPLALQLGQAQLLDTKSPPESIHARWNYMYTEHLAIG